MWDRERECGGGCWTQADGGWAARMWGVYQLAATHDGMSGRWQVDWQAVRMALGEAAMADDEARVDAMAAMRTCASVLNAPARDPGSLLWADDDDG